MTETADTIDDARIYVTAPASKSGEGKKTRYSDDVKEMAYLVWATEAAQSPTRTKELMLSGDFGPPIDITDRTIRQWAHTHNWRQRFVDDAFQFAPGVYNMARANVVLGTQRGTSYLLRVIDDDSVKPETRVSAAIALCHMGGLSPVGKNHATHQMTSNRAPMIGIESGELRNLSEDELMRAELVARKHLADH